MLVDQVHQLVVSMRIICKSTDVFGVVNGRVHNL